MRVLALVLLLVAGAVPATAGTTCEYNSHVEQRSVLTGHWLVMDRSDCETDGRYAQWRERLVVWEGAPNTPEAKVLVLVEWLAERVGPEDAGNVKRETVTLGAGGAFARTQYAQSSHGPAPTCGATLDTWGALGVLGTGAGLPACAPHAALTP